MLNIIITDILCTKCPHNQAGVCFSRDENSNQRVILKDKRVLKDNINQKELAYICDDCEWLNEYCSHFFAKDINNLLD